MNSLSQFKIDIKYWMTVPANCVNFIFKILDLYNVKSYTFVKLANLGTISKKKNLLILFLDRHICLDIFAQLMYS